MKIKQIFKIKFILLSLLLFFSYIGFLPRAEYFNASVAMNSSLRLPDQMKKRAYECATGEIFDYSDVKVDDITYLEKPDGSIKFYYRGNNLNLCLPNESRFVKDVLELGEYRLNLDVEKNKDEYYKPFIRSDGREISGYEIMLLKEQAYEKATGKFFCASGLTYKDIVVREFGGLGIFDFYLCENSPCVVDRVYGYVLNTYYEKQHSFDGPYFKYDKSRRLGK